MFGVDVESLKKDILDYINQCVEDYRATRDKKYLYDLLEFCNWLIEISKSIVEILKGFGIPIETKTETEIIKYRPMIYATARLKAEPIVIEIPEIEIKLPEEVKTKTAKVGGKEYSEEYETEEEIT